MASLVSSTEEMTLWSWAGARDTPAREKGAVHQGNKSSQEF